MFFSFTKTRAWRGFIFMSLPVIPVLGCVSQDPPLSATSQSGVEETAIAAYIYGYPLVLENATKAAAISPAAISAGQGAPLNEFSSNTTLASPSSTAVVTQSVDVLYSSAWLDLSKGPIVFHIPETTSDRFYVMEILDGWTNVFADPGSRTTGNGEQDYVIVGPHWSGDLPKGVPVFSSPTDLAWIIGRIEVNGPSDVPAVNAIQAGLSLTPLHSFSSGSAPAPRAGPSSAPGAAPANGSSSQTPTQEVAKMDAESFFRNLAKEMCESRAAPEDAPALRRFRSFGFVPCRPFQPDPEIVAAIRDVPQKAQQEIANDSKQLGKVVNGWRINTQELGKYGTDYATRAAVALIGLGANLPEDAVYPATFVDSDGQALVGTRDYRLHFDADQIPPVDGFWSITLYDSQNHFVPNAINRYAITDKSGLQYNPDGSLDIDIQNQKPQNEPEANWLPAPTGAFNLALRLYAPKPDVLNGAWAPPPVLRVESR